MPNQTAADYMRNIICSVATPPGVEASQNMPGEFLTITFFLMAGLDGVPIDDSCEGFVANPLFDAAVQDYIRANNRFGAGSDVPAFGAANVAGQVPRRDTNGAPYADGSTNGAYRNPFTGTYSYTAGSPLNTRNLIAGDFNGDGQRNLNDIPDMVAAYLNPVGWATTAPGSSAANPAIPEILGDFDGDGNFTAADVRYFADGLALDPVTGQLDRQAAFIAVDTAFGGNFFGTTIAGGLPYTLGDSRFDVAGNVASRGAKPTGHDGVVDTTDLAYIEANFGDWASLTDAQLIDLSCDMTGDLKVDQQDVLALKAVLGLGALCGDTNCDGVVDTADIDNFVYVVVNGAAAPGCPTSLDAADTNGDGAVDTADIDSFVAAVVNGGCQ